MNILLNISFYVPRKKECHTGLEWHEQMSTFSGELSLSWTLRNSCCLSGKIGAGRFVSSVSMSNMGLTADTEVRCVWTNVTMVYVCVCLHTHMFSETHLYQPCKILFDLYIFDIDKSSRMAAFSPFPLGLNWASCFNKRFWGHSDPSTGGPRRSSGFFSHMTHPPPLSPIPSS